MYTSGRKVPSGEPCGPALAGQVSCDRQGTRAHCNNLPADGHNKSAVHVVVARKTTNVHDDIMQLLLERGAEDHRSSEVITTDGRTSQLRVDDI